MSSRKRDTSPFWDGNTHHVSDHIGADFTRSLRGLIDKFAGAKPDPANPVVNGASESQKPWLRGLIADIATQLPRIGANASLLTSLVDTQFFSGGLVDDKTYQMEKIIQLLASLPTDVRAQDELSGGLIGKLWGDLQHPPLSLQGAEYKYRKADGSYNNLLYPQLGKAGSSYARTVAPKTLQPGALPDPGVIFDSIFARSKTPKQHPNKISSMLFYLASIIIHDVFHTDPRDPARVKTSSYLDLAPLYGSSDEEQARVRSGKDGLLLPDTFSESRLLGFPPGVSALLICFNRYHNYIAIQLKQINEGGKFTVPSDPNDTNGLKKLDEDLFQTARLVTCGLYVNIILIDYVRTILNLNRSPSTWSLDPRENSEIFDSMKVPQGTGNQVSVEFNLVYRWHSATSINDEAWTTQAYEKIFPGQDITKISEKEFIFGLRKWIAELGSDPSKWPLDLGKYQRNERGAFHDQDLVDILTNATEDVSCAFGARQVPVAMKLIEVMGMKQARAWNVATLNEFRKFFSLEPHKEFADISSDPDVQHALKALYKHPDYVELYPGLVAEDAKEVMTPGSGICLGYTNSRTILSDAVALVRGDRFYTVDYSPANLTNWGFNQIKSDPDVAQGHCISNLIMRALPGYYRGDSVYAMFPFVVPSENQEILRSLGMVKDYSYDRPSLIPNPIAIKTWQGVVDILGDHDRFKVPWGPHITYLTGRDYMLGNDEPKASVDHKGVDMAIYCPMNGLDQIRKFYEALTKQLIVIGQERLGEEWFQLDICRDVAQPSHSVFVAKLWHIPLKAKGDDSLGVEVDKMYLAMALMFAYVFLDQDTARSFRLRKAAKDATDQMSMLCKIVCGAVKAGKRLPISKLFHMGEEGQMLESYGRNLILRMFDNGWDVDTVVANLIPTAAAAVGTQAQHMTQMIDVYLRDEYKHHWPAIQKLAQSDRPEDFEILKSYALEANRLAPASYGLVRLAATDATIRDGDRNVDLKPKDIIYTDFLSAGIDEKTFPDPLEIKLDRDRSKYIHHGWGMHACIGRQIVEISMATQLKVFAQLKNLRRAPGPQGQLKFTYPQPNPVSSDPVPAPGLIKAFMKEDWGDFWPFPTSLKVHHDGFYASYETTLVNDLFQKTGLPDAEAQIIASSRENSRSPSASPHRHRHHLNGRNGSTHHADFIPPIEGDEDEDDLAYGNGEEKVDMAGVINGSPPPKIAVNGNHLHPSSAKEEA